MSELSINKISKDFYSIEQEYVRSFLICGDNQALLIDTGLGNTNLKEIIESITLLPIMVIFTHGDGDHMGAVSQFDRRFMHPSEFDYYVMKSKQNITMEPIWEGDIIDLGNYCFEIILIPGHTPGSIALLEKNKRFLISGDSVQTGQIFMFGNGRNFNAFRASMRKLQERIEEFDHVYASHDTLCVDPSTVNLLYDAAGKMINNELNGIPQERFEGKVKAYTTHGVGFLAY